MLIHDERLTRRTAVATNDDLVASPIPPSVQAVLAARIERLPADQRAVMQRASVVGRVFWWGAIADLSPREEQGQIGSILQTLIRAPSSCPMSPPSAARTPTSFATS